MARVSRIHRLPQRLDYALIPAPLDLTLPTASEKDALPSIIVTPSSPTHGPEAGYFLAFLAPPPQPKLHQRVAQRIRAICPFPREGAVKLAPTPAADATTFTIVQEEPAPATCLPSALQFRARTTVLLLLLLFIMACHLLTHRLAIVRPYLDFKAAAVAPTHEGTVAPSAAPADAAWWDLQWLWDGADGPQGEKRDFVVEAFPSLSNHI